MAGGGCKPPPVLVTGSICTKRLFVPELAGKFGNEEGIPMESEKNKKIVIGLLIVAVVIIGIGMGMARNSAPVVNAVPKSGEVSYDNEYQQYLDEYGYNGSLSDSMIEIDVMQYETSSDMVAMSGEEGVLTEDNGSITWSFETKEEGFYNLELGYISLPGTTSDIQRKIYIDNEIPYEALAQVVIKRWWQDEPIKVKNQNEIRPESVEIYQEKKWFIEDYQRRNNEALLFYLEKGKHTITFEVIKEPLEITSLTFMKAPRAASYGETIAQLKEQYEVYTGENILCQAERVEDATKDITKSSFSINIQKNYSDSEIQPYHPYNIVYNTMGANSWAVLGDSITWGIQVEKEGLYELTVKGRQNTNRGVTSYRKLSVNGEVPYGEMKSVGFHFQSGMNNYTIADETGEPYLFYLNEGYNTITLENVMGPMGSIVTQVEESLSVLNGLYLDVIQLTGQSPDRFIDYEIAKKIPDFCEKMQSESDRLYWIIDEVVAITGEEGENTALLQKMAFEAAELAKDPESVVLELNQLKNNVSALATWLVNVASMPLEIDYLVLSGEGAKLPDAEDTFFAGAWNGTIRFFSTFFVKNSQISEDVEGEGDSTIKVWLASFGREQAQLIQNMLEEDFTPDTNVSVNLQLIPVDVVLRAALAGNGPDVVIGLGQTTLQDFAMRNAIYDLSQFEDYRQVTERFYESTLATSNFLDGYYGIPEQATFMMLFTRDDIMEELGLETPATWTQLLEMIPVLQKNNYNAYVPNLQQVENSMIGTSIEYNMHLYQGIVMQNGGNPYLGTGSDYGIESGLVSDEAMEAFKDYTDFYTSYGLDLQLDFANRFRTGEVPVGIINYTLFNQLEIFAPEIKGLWSFHEIPGVEQEDGSINHTFAVDTVQSVIMAKSEKKNSAWEFLKWWTGTQVQLDFANALEALMGSSARYAAADPEVLRQLPWSNAELESLLGQLEETVGIPAVPGSYMSTRMVQYAFNDVVGENANPRETLYLNIKDINQELTRKRQELHLSTVK